MVHDDKKHGKDAKQFDIGLPRHNGIHVLTYFHAPERFFLLHGCSMSFPLILNGLTDNYQLSEL
jgi:hypothetical protein